MAKTKSITQSKSKGFEGTRVGIWLRPQDQAVVARLGRKWTTKLTTPGTTEIIRRSLEIAESSTV